MMLDYVLGMGAHPQSAPGGTWTPAELTGAIWFDFDDPSTLTQGGGYVTEIRDANGSGKKYTVATSLVAMVSDGTAGDVAEFSGTRMTGNFNNGADVGATDGSYYDWAVFRATSAIDSANPWNNRLIGGDIASWHNLYVRNVSGTPKVGAYHYDGANKIVLIDQALSTWVFAGQEHSSGQLRLRLNGGSESTTAAGNQSGSGTDNLGGGSYAGRIRMRGFLPSAPSESDRQKLEGWAAHLCGIASSLPGGHPYKSAPP